jgi:glycosyltransferase involved in cell wall biosynthesis
MNLALVLTQEFDPHAGGVQRSTSKMAKIFHSNNHHVIILAVGNHKTRQEVFESIDLYYINIEEGNQLKRVLQRENICCIINQMGYSLMLTKLLLKNKPISTKLINTLRINPLNFYDNHENLIREVLQSKKIGILNTILTRKIILHYHIVKQKLRLPFIVKNTDAFVMLSKKFEPELFFLVPSLKKYRHKIHGIGNPFQRPDIALKTIKKENIILFVGRLNIAQKRVDLLLQIWKNLHEQLPDWQFWICGEGEEKNYMEQFCVEHKMDRVRFYGKVNPTEYYKKSKIFHMTSAFEGFGNVLIEAQSFGSIPILFDSYAAASDIVENNKNGFLIPTFDVDAYVRQTIELIQNSLKMEEMAEEGFENVLRFSYEKAYEKWENVFESMK